MDRKEKIEKKLTVAIMVALGILFYVICGKEWICIEKDSEFYLNPGGRQGVMPIYPLFLYSIKKICGEKIFLDAVVIIQSALAIVCTMIFSLYVKKRFKLNFFEGVFIYLLTMLPFSIYLPETGITHQIMTEGIAYSFFYIYFLFLMQYVWEKRNKYFILVLVSSIILALTRSQLQFLIVINFFIFIYVEFSKKREEKKHLQLLYFGRALGLGGVIAICFLLTVGNINSSYLRNILPIIREEESEEEEGIGNNSESVVDKNHDFSDEPYSQYEVLLITRSFYEIDENDVFLFEDKHMQKLFNKIFAALSEAEFTHEFARQDLYMWKDLVKDKLSGVVLSTTYSYIEENPEIQIDEKKMILEMAFSILIHHFDRYMYHNFRLMVSSTISAVFFQIDRIYLLCHIITAVILLFSIVNIFICSKLKGDKKAVEFMSVTLAFILLMVVIINLLFFGMQRYMVYAMGIFYCALYVNIKENYMLLRNNQKDN